MTFVAIAPPPEVTSVKTDAAPEVATENTDPAPDVTELKMLPTGNMVSTGGLCGISADLLSWRFSSTMGFAATNTDATRQMQKAMESLANMVMMVNLKKVEVRKFEVRYSRRRKGNLYKIEGGKIVVDL